MDTQMEETFEFKIGQKLLLRNSSMALITSVNERGSAEGHTLPEGKNCRNLSWNNKGTCIMGQEFDVSSVFTLTAPEGRKFDSGKPRPELLFSGMPLALTEIVKVLTFGSAKYEDHNWQYVEGAPGRYLGASMRHELAFQLGEARDQETQLHHLAHKICCDLFRLELELKTED